MHVKNRVISAGVVAVVGVGGAIGLAAPASAASAAANAFSACMDHYLAGEKDALNLRQSAVATAILYTGYANCYYELSQRSDITSTQEVNAVAQYEHYEPMAEQAITKAGLTYYKSLLKYGLKGLEM